MCYRRNAVWLWLVAVLAMTPIHGAATLDRGLGLRPPTAEELACYLSVTVAVTAIQPNDMAVARATAEAAAARRQGRPVTVRDGLPSAVDNSTLPYFPPVRSQGAQGSCVAWASSYYYSTYTQAQDEGRTVSGGDDSLICSPGFMYNLINYGADSGSSIPYAMLKLSQVGCSTWADKPYDAADYLSWPSETAWVGALRHRTSTPHTVDISTPSGQTTIKQHLANGDLAVVSMAVHQTWYDDYTMSDATGISNGVYYAPDGAFVGGHALTLVGYDDSRSYVDHRDGQTHYGAFLIANSWGNGWGLRNSTGVGTKGFFWAAYAGFTDGTMDSQAYFNDDRPDYRPALYAVAGVNHAERDRLTLNSSIGSPTAWQSHNAIWNDGGATPISDTDAIAVDMTDGVGYLGSPPTLVAARLAVAPGAGTSATVTRADFYEDLDGNGFYAVHSSPDPTVTVPSGAVGLATLWLTPSSGVDCDVTAAALPSSMQWDDATSSTVTVRNLGTSTWLVGDGHQLLWQDSVDRWGVTSVPLSADLAPGNSHDFTFDLVAPPVSTLAYMPPVTDTAPGVLDTLPLDLTVALGATPLDAGEFSQEIVVSRFPDIQPGTAGAWARFYVEECAGRVPTIVGGYWDGTYRPSDQVTRGQMAVFIQRALVLPLGSYDSRFSDVAVSHWAASQIQSCVDAGIVGGYSDGTYCPEAVITRDAMSVFIARGLAGGDSGVPPGPGTATFTDVPTSHWAFRYVEHAVAQGVVGGYGDGTYRPTTPVDRGQMAVFVYRGFIQPAGSSVVLAGPAITAQEPATGGECGWASAAGGAAADPGYAYLSLDAVRLDTNLTGPDSFFDVCFELRAASAPATPAVDPYRYTVALDAAALTAAKGAAMGTGYPHYAVAWDLPAGLTPGSYVLVVSLEDSQDIMREIARKPAFVITP